MTRLAHALATLVVALATFDAALAAPDVARERRMADQIVPQLVVGDAAWLSTPSHRQVLALYTEPARASRNAVVIVHGLGVDPDWNLIGVLRTRLADLGFATLSVQMPVLAADAPRDDYKAVFPDAGERLTAAVAWLRARNFAHIAVVSHSMGAAMVNAWLAKAPLGAIDAWVPVGLLVDFDARLRMPVLDVVAERDLPEALAWSKTRARELRDDRCSASLIVAGTDHYFDAAGPRLAQAIRPFLDAVFAGGCG